MAHSGFLQKALGCYGAGLESGPMLELHRWSAAGCLFLPSSLLLHACLLAHLPTHPAHLAAAAAWLAAAVADVTPRGPPGGGRAQQHDLFHHGCLWEDGGPRRASPAAQVVRRMCWPPRGYAVHSALTVGCSRHRCNALIPAACCSQPACRPGSAAASPASPTAHLCSLCTLACTAAMQVRELRAAHGGAGRRGGGAQPPRPATLPRRAQRRGRAWGSPVALGVMPVWLLWLPLRSGCSGLHRVSWMVCSRRAAAWGSTALAGGGQGRAADGRGRWSRVGAHVVISGTAPLQCLCCASCICLCAPTGCPAVNRCSCGPPPCAC